MLNRTKIEEKYFDKIYQFIGLKDTIKLVDFSFKKPWWNIFTKQKNNLILQLVSNILLYGYIATLPLLIGLAINNGDINTLGMVLFGLLFVYIVTFINTKSFIIFKLTVFYNITFYAQKFFQTVDPIAHSTRSSGQIISKVSRLEKGYDELISLVEADIIPFFIKVITLILVLSRFDLVLALYATLFITLAAISDWITRVFINLVFSKKKIIAQDAVKSIEIESLMQIQHIRSVFSTPEQLKRLNEKQSEMYTILGTSFRSNNYSLLLTRLILFLGTAVLSLQIFSLIKAGNLDRTVGISLLITFIGGSSDCIAIGKKFEKSMQVIIEIKDTFTFIRGFGKQTFPVLEEEEEYENVNFKI